MTEDRSAASDHGETFLDVVASEFGFLLDRGFRSVVESEGVVVYEATNGVFVRVFRDATDLYVGFRVGLGSRPRDALTTPEFARLTGAKCRGDYPESASDLRAGAARLAQLLRDFGDRVLSGDEKILDEAMALRRQHTNSFTRPRRSNKSERSVDDEG
jgi:hypothetical protein